MAKNKEIESLSKEELEKLCKELSKKKKAARSKVWTFILYLEDKDTAELLNYLRSDNVEKARGFYIIHKGEPMKNEDGTPRLDEDGAPKVAKDHVHVMVEFPNARSASGVQKALCFDMRQLAVEPSEVGDEPDDENEHKTKMVQPVSDRVSMYLYFLHWTYRCSKQGKERYKESDIQLLGNNSPDFLLSCSYDKEKTARSTCAELLQRAEGADEQTLLMNCIEDEQLIKFIMKNPYFVSKFIIKGGKFRDR